MNNSHRYDILSGIPADNGKTDIHRIDSATDTGANLPKKEAYNGAPNKANISRMILANNAIAPSCEAISIPADASFSCTISKEDKE